MLTKQRGFTIVELLVVIIVIAIIAAVTVLAFNGVQERSRYSAMQQDIATMDRLIKLYYADNGFYPNSSASATTYVTANMSNIPGLIPKYTSSMPVIPNDRQGGYYAYIASANGVNYKLVRLSTNASTLPDVEKSHPSPDATRPGRGWGVWSSGGSNL